MLWMGVVDVGVVGCSSEDVVEIWILSSEWLSENLVGCIEVRCTFFRSWWCTPFPSCTWMMDPFIGTSIVLECLLQNFNHSFGLPLRLGFAILLNSIFIICILCCCVWRVCVLVLLWSVFWVVSLWSSTSFEEATIGDRHGKLRSNSTNLSCKFPYPWSLSFLKRLVTTIHCKEYPI